MTKLLPMTKVAPTLPKVRTAGMVRAEIFVKHEFLRQSPSDSREYWRLQQQLADLERELHSMEAPSHAS